MCLLALTRKMTLVFKVGRQRSLNGVTDRSGDSYLIGYKIEEISQKFEEVDKLEKIEESLKSIAQKIDCISQSIKGLQPLETFQGLTSPESFKLENLCIYLEKIQEIEGHLKPFKETMCKLEGQKDQIKILAEKLTKQCKTETVQFSRTDNLESTTQGECPQTSQNSEGYYFYITKITKTIVTCKTQIVKLLPQVDKEMSKLQNEYVDFKKHLEAIKQQMEDLKTMIKLSKGLNVIGGFNQKLQSYITKSEKDGKSHLYELIKKLVSAKTSVEDIKSIIDKECSFSKYLIYIYLMRFSVRRTLCLTEKQYLSSKSGSKAYLNLARSGLYFIMCRLTELLRLGENILNLSYPILAINQLQKYKDDIKGLDEHKKRLIPFMRTLDPYLKVLDKIGTDIKKIYDLKDKLPKLEVLSKLPNLENMPENLKTISYHYTSIVRLNLGIGGLSSKEFMEALKKIAGAGGVGGGQDSSVLEQIKETLSKATTENSEEITQTFKEKVQRILSQCSSRLKIIEVPKTEVQQTICSKITTCLVHARRLIVISNVVDCRQLEVLVPDLRTKLNELETGIPDLATLCQPNKVCGTITAAVTTINLSCHSADEILQCFSNCIRELEEKLKEIEDKKSKIEEAFEKVKSSMQSIEKAKALLVDLSRSRGYVTFKVECLEHNLDKVTDELVPFLDKVDSVICTLEKEIEHLQSQLETTKTELDIINGFKCDVNEAIRFIEEIKSHAGNIKTHYDSYKSNFTSFEEKLKDLETCLDYLIKGFLSCSLSTTICRLKRQIPDTTWECPDSSCNTCQVTTLMTDKVYSLEEQLYRYSRLVLGHTSTLDTRQLVSKLYDYCKKFDKIFCIIQIVSMCCCVCKYRPTDTNEGESAAFYFYDIKDMVKCRKYNEIAINKDSKNSCLCLVVKYVLYPSLAKATCYLVAIELDISGTISRRMGNYASLNGYCGYHGYKAYLSVLLMLAINVFDKLSECINKRYVCNCKTDSKCCCKPSDKPKGDSSSKPCKEDCTACKLRVKPCCECHNSKDSQGCTPEKCGCKCKCEQVKDSKDSKDGETPCACHLDNNCCCYICFCWFWEDPLYPWFISVIVWMAWLLDTVFTLSYSDVQHCIQLLSNLWSDLGWLWCDANKPCAIASITATSPSPPTEPATPSPTPTILNVKCCLVCVNVKVVCVSTHFLCFTSVLIGKCKPDKEEDKKEECKLLNIVCICKCESGNKCLEQIKKLADNNNNLKCDLFKGLNDKLTQLKNVNGPTPKWSIVCDCKSGTPNCPCKLTSDTLKDPCQKLTVDFKEFDKDYFKCGCESVVKCCCCCKCEECGNGKTRHCNKKEEGNGGGHGHNGHGTTQTNGQQGTQAVATQAGTNGQVECPCQEEGSEQCCCIKQGTGPAGKSKGCNCTKAEGEPSAPTTPCKCCCLSCCADEKNEDKPQGQPQAQPESQQTNGNKCPCKKKKKEKKKVHCKNYKKYKDKRCCCKCRPKEKGEGANNNSNGVTPAGDTTTPKDDKDCCCCCKCNTRCKGGTSGDSAPSAPSGGNGVSGAGGSAGTTGTSGCTCHNSSQQVQNGQTSGQHKCNCYCCFECKHEKSAVKSVCKQIAYELKSSIFVLSKLALRVVVTTFVCLSK